MSDLLTTDKENEEKDIFDLFSIDDIPADIAEGINTDVFAKELLNFLSLQGGHFRLMSLLWVFIANIKMKKMAKDKTAGYS